MGFHGEGRERAASVRCGSPDEVFTAGKQRGSGCNGTAVLGKRAAGDRLDAEGNRVAFGVAFIGCGGERRVGDGEGGVLGCAG